ncbi:hypothetical protein TorRG33x02_253620 [Trema orientale]|uniref:Uncharacterized protein n=1 Tax=Trema orientale TaxID=63057 RepID=A0A2P5DET6_TREOI|nr:hypothetical protein TorRG33x02_253620 [Trema orientale]
MRLKVWVGKKVQDEAKTIGGQREVKRIARGWRIGRKAWPELSVGEAVCFLGKLPGKIDFLPSTKKKSELFFFFLSL